MENGVFVEQGKHDDLITLNGYYSSMMKQFHKSTENPSRATSMCSIWILSQKPPNNDTIFGFPVYSLIIFLKVDDVKRVDDEDQGATPQQKKPENGVQNGTTGKTPEVGQLHKDKSYKGEKNC